MNSKMKLPFAVGIGALASLVLLFFINPTASGVFPDCPSRVLFGVECPGCGGMRGTYSLLRGDLSSALNQNALLLGFYPMVVTLWFFWILRTWNQKDFFAMIRPYSRLVLGFGIFVVVGFTIMRNVMPGLGSGLGS